MDSLIRSEISARVGEPALLPAEEGWGEGTFRPLPAMTELGDSVRRRQERPIPKRKEVFTNFISFFPCPLQATRS